MFYLDLRFFSLFSFLESRELPVTDPMQDYKPLRNINAVSHNLTGE
jgi:hypothetical protein